MTKYQGVSVLPPHLQNFVRNDAVVCRSGAPKTRILQIDAEMVQIAAPFPRRPRRSLWGVGTAFYLFLVVGVVVLYDSSLSLTGHGTSDAPGTHATAPLPAVPFR